MEVLPQYKKITISEHSLVQITTAQQAFASGSVSIGPERFELWGALLLTLQEGTVCDPLPILTEGRGMLPGWQEASPGCRRGGGFQIEG